VIVPPSFDHCQILEHQERLVKRDVILLHALPQPTFRTRIVRRNSQGTGRACPSHRRLSPSTIASSPPSQLPRHSTAPQAEPRTTSSAHRTLDAADAQIFISSTRESRKALLEGKHGRRQVRCYCAHRARDAADAVDRYVGLILAVSSSLAIGTNAAYFALNGMLTKAQARVLSLRKRA
jgi:hypothetical protein